MSYLKTQNIFNTFVKNVVLLEISQGVSPLVASWGMATFAQKKHLSFVVVFWYAEIWLVHMPIHKNQPKNNDKSQQLQSIWIRRYTGNPLLDSAVLRLANKKAENKQLNEN